MAEAEDFLVAYDQQLRTDAETPSAISVARLGSLRLASFSGGRGFVTYPRPQGDEAARLPGLVGAVLEHYRADPATVRVEWKTRGHDGIAGLEDALTSHGFERQESESIMVGLARLLDVDVPLPAGVVLRQVRDEDDVRSIAELEDIVFGTEDAEDTTRALLHRLSLDDGMQLWVAQAEGMVICAGRLEPVAGSDFAGIWGGATLPAWRGKGVYRALTAARARSALAAGKTLIHSDSTEYSRPILERAGLLKVSTTTPYVWHR